MSPSPKREPEPPDSEPPLNPYGATLAGTDAIYRQSLWDVAPAGHAKITQQRAA